MPLFTSKLLIKSGMLNSEEYFHSATAMCTSIPSCIRGQRQPELVVDTEPTMGTEPTDPWYDEPAREAISKRFRSKIKPKKRDLMDTEKAIFEAEKKRFENGF